MTDHPVPRYRVTSDGLIMFDGSPPSIPLAGLVLVHEADYLAVAELQRIEKLSAAAHIILARAIGALVDAGDVETEDVEHGIEQLTAQRDEALAKLASVDGTQSTYRDKTAYQWHDEAMNYLKRWHDEVDELKATLAQAESHLAEARQAIGLATTCVPSLVMDVEHPIDMMQRVVDHLAQRENRENELARAITAWIAANHALKATLAQAEQRRKNIHTLLAVICGHSPDEPLFDLIDEVAVVTQRVAELEADVICGGSSPGQVGCCGKALQLSEAYRCTHCMIYFHRACADQHFELDAYVKAIRDKHNAAFVVDWKAAVTKAEHERDRLQARVEMLESEAGYHEAKEVIAILTGQRGQALATLAQAEQRVAELEVAAKRVCSYHVVKLFGPERPPLDSPQYHFARDRDALRKLLFPIESSS